MLCGAVEISLGEIAAMKKVTDFVEVIGFKRNLPVVQCDGKNYKNTSKMQVQI